MSSMEHHPQGNYCCYPPHIIVQRLNNRGAFFIERREYDAAIQVLIDALNLWESALAVETAKTMKDDSSSSSSSSSRSSPSPSPSCSTGTRTRTTRCSNDCSIEECILQARQLSPTAIYNHRTNNKNSKKATSSSTEKEDEESFIYRQPIVTNSRFLQRDCKPGHTLSLIVILNLALAFHLSAIEIEEPNDFNVDPTTTKSKPCRRKLQQALYVYEMAHRIQIDYNICSPQATMIVSNNVGEIHRISKNHLKHIVCLEHLLSTMMMMMYMIRHHNYNYNYYNNNNSSNNNNNQVTTTRQEGIEEQWGGFLRNTSQLILHNNCAGAA